MPQGGNFADLQNQEFDWGGDAPSSFDFGNMSAPNDWLAFLESGEFSDFTMPQDTMGGSIGEGTQTVDWDLGGIVGEEDNFGGFLYGTGYQDFSGEDIASMIAQMGLQYAGEGPGGGGMGAIQFYESFEDQFGDMFSTVTWGSGAGTPGGDMSNLSQLYAQEEANLWSSYDNWMSSQYSLLEQQYGNIYSDYTEGLENITDARTQSLKDLIENRRQQELNLTDELTSGTRAAGRGGFGTTGRQTDSLSQAQNILSAGTTGAYDIVQTSEAAMESLLQGTENQAALLYNQFALSAESEQLNINQQLQLMGTEFEMESESIYSDWLDSLMDLTSEIIASDAELNLPSTGFEFNPFGESLGCPPGFVLHPGTGECVDPDAGQGFGGGGEVTLIDDAVSDQLFDTEA